MSDVELVRSHVVDDPATVLARALDDELTGHALVEPQDAFLLGDDAVVRVVFDEGVPIRVAATNGDRAGPAAVETLVGPGPFAVELYRRPAGVDRSDAAASVPPDLPARRVDDDGLAARTRAAAPDEHRTADDPVASFLDDAEVVESIRDAAREEAVADARQWGLTDHLATDPDGSDDPPTGGQ
jgi:hypothetical protein